MSSPSWVDDGLQLWFGLTALSVAYVASVEFIGNSAQRRSSLAMATMRWGWVLVTLYVGPFGALTHWLLHRDAAPATLPPPPPPLWKQTVESTIHCVAGDATGVLIAAVAARWLHLPGHVEVVVEYVVGFAVGLFAFQAPCMKSTFGSSYWRSVRGTLLPEALSMNAVMAGMIPVMALAMSLDMAAMDPTSLHFFGTMSMAFIAGTVATLPVNAWLVYRGLKHGMGGEARAQLRHSVATASKATAMVLTLAMLGCGIILATHFAG